MPTADGRGGGDDVTRLRGGPYVWITWLSKLAAGETQCQWAPWFRTHHADYQRAPSDFQLASWTAQHTRMVDLLAHEREAAGEGVFKEEQNRFRVRRPSGLVIAGKPDLITLGEDGAATVYDAKTGKPRQSDVIQVMLYMMCLPYAYPLYRDKRLQGRVVYKSGDAVPIPAGAIDEEFRGVVTYYLDLLESESPPSRTPSAVECGFCDLTAHDCPDRMDPEELAEAPEMPI